MPTSITLNMKTSRIKTIAVRVGVFILVTLLMAIVFLYAVMWVCVNGPSERARNIFVMSVRETSAVGFLANLYLSEKEIAEIMDSNKIIVADGNTDTSLIDIVPSDKENGVNNSDNDDIRDDTSDIEFHKVSGVTYKGIMAIIKDPSRVFVGISGEYGEDKEGKTITEIAKSYEAVLATNAGGFKDENGFGLGGEPLGMVISEGELKYGDDDKVYEIGGFNKDNILIVGSMTTAQAMEAGIRDAVSFGPILVLNGVPSTISGTGSGLNPRTAIGQRSDGAVLLLTIDGRQTSSFGALYQDVVNVMVEYGAVNAINLDGGSSTAMYYDGKIINSVSTGGSLRDLPTAILVK